jgi:hypothetical protein
VPDRQLDLFAHAVMAVEQPVQPRTAPIAVAGLDYAALGDFAASGAEHDI